MAITYERTMKLRYELTERCSDRQVLGQFLSNLHDKGISLMDNSWDDAPSKKLGLQQLTETTTVRTLTIDGKDIDIYSSQTDTELDHILTQLNDLGFTASKSESVTETTTEGYGVPDSSYAYIRYNGVGGNRLRYETKDGSVVEMKVRVYQDSWNNRDMTLTFTIEWNPSKVQRKDAIESALVDLTVKDMGKIQRIVEDNLHLLKWDNESPMIDCHFDAKTETRSECAPDIIQRVRDARKQEDEQNGEEE